MLVIAIAAATACEPESPTRPSDEIVTSAPDPLSFVPGGPDTHYPAGITVNIVAEEDDGTSPLPAAPPFIRDAVSQAAAVWNTDIFDLPGHFNDLPHLNTQIFGGGEPGGEVFRVIYKDESTQGNNDTGFCGSSEPPSGNQRRVRVFKQDMNATCPGDPTARIVNDLFGVVIHEITHVIGFQHQSTSETFYCLSNVTALVSLNHQPCIWEQQSIYAAYDIRGGSENDPFPATRIADRVRVVPGTVLTVQTNSSITIQVEGLYGPEPSQNQQDPPEAVSIEVDWIESSPRILKGFETDNSVVITGLQVGTAQLIAQAVPQEAAAFPWPADTIDIAVVSASGLDPSFSISQPTWRNTDQYVIATGTRGSNIQYRWKFSATGSWTPFTADTLYEFLGHGTANTHPVTMEIKNTSTGATEQNEQPVTVTSNLLTMSGPAAITQKKLKTYTASGATNPCWFDRFGSELTWLSLGTCANSTNFIWPAGEYSAVMRAEKSSAQLGRARVDVEVCTVTQNCDQVEFLVGPPGAAPTVLQEWGLFGLGPWMTATLRGQDDLLRLYDLTGGWESGSPFASTDWLSQGSGAFARNGWSVAWEMLEDPWDDAQLIRFQTTAPSGAHQFGMAVDPDLGRNAADDRSGFDVARHMVYAVDGSRTVGFLIVDSDGASGLSVQQYGARALAPRVLDDAWDRHQASGVNLSAGEDDVQFLIRKDAVAGTAVWTFVIVRGATVRDIQAQADAVLSRLGG